MVTAKEKMRAKTGEKIIICHQRRKSIPICSWLSAFFFFVFVSAHSILQGVGNKSRDFP